MNIRYLPFTRWWHWILTIFLVTGGLGINAVIFLTKSPEETSCTSESNQTAANVIYCATMSVDEQDAAKLSEAIQLVNTIPQDSPLRSNADKLIERWSQAIMHLGQKAFHAGDINKAVEITLIIPHNHSSYQAASEQVKQWQLIWSQAEAIYASANSKIQDGSKNWYAALAKAKQLQTLENDYWANTKYYELVRHIQGAREGREKVEAEKLASQKAQIEENHDYIASSDKSDELGQLNKARTLANSGKIDDMRAALVEASMVISEPNVKDARKLIAETENKIAVFEDNLYLEEAKKLAVKNDEISLKMAVNEAKLIGKERPLYREANKQIAIWDKKISKLTTQPVQLIGANNQKVSSDKVSTNVNTTLKVKSELKPVLDNSNMAEKIDQSIEKLEEAQINY